MGTQERTTASELARQVRDGDLTAEGIVEQHLAHIHSRDGELHSFITVDDSSALSAAQDIDRRRRRGEAVGALAGVPIGVKDSIPTRGLRTTGNSRLLADWIPQHDAPVVERLRRADAVIIGKTNLNELGWSVPCEEDLTPPPRNPWNTTYRAVGSSSGSGAAVAAGLCPVSIGTDGGGSARLPAGQMGLIGLKPTRDNPPYDSVDGGGLLSNVGLLGTNTADVSLVWNAVANTAQGDDEGDTGTALVGEDVVLGIPADVFMAGDVEPEVRRAFDDLVHLLRAQSIQVVEVPSIDLDLARAAAFVTLKGERAQSAELLIRADRSLVGRSTRVYAAGGLGLSVADYTRGLRVGRVFSSRVDEQLRTVDALLMPTSSVVTAEAARGPGHSRGKNAVYTAPFNLSGHPAISVPAGVSASTRLPIGVQLVGPKHGEDNLLALAQLLEDRHSAEKAE